MVEKIGELFDDRRVPWDGLGTDAGGAVDSITALQAAGLDWSVKKRPVWVENQVLSDFYANVRCTDGKVLGIVGRDYRIVQNREAFAFTDSLRSQIEISFEAAGSFQDGRRVWLLARMPEVRLLDDRLQPYLVFMNGHDGRHAMRAAITPIRVRCSNMLNLAFSQARRSWAVPHLGNMQQKLREAAVTIQNLRAYLEGIQFLAESLMKVRIPRGWLEEIINQTLPLPEDGSRQKRVLDLRDELLIRYMEAPDLNEYRGTGWGFVNAVSDLMGHSKPGRPSKTFKENRFAGLVAGSPEIDRAVRICLALEERRSTVRANERPLTPGL